jgi:caffeoyl-CoA O-methyltransferase
VGFNRHVCNDKRVEAVMLPIRDGLTLAWKS